MFKSDLNRYGWQAALKQKSPDRIGRFHHIPSMILKAKPAINRGVDETPEEIPSATAEAMDQKVLGETPEAVKPCLEEHEQEQETMLEC